MPPNLDAALAEVCADLPIDPATVKADMHPGDVEAWECGELTAEVLREYACSLAAVHPGRADLYQGWLSGLGGEPRTLATLTDEQHLQAVAAGMVSADEAQACVILAYRAPSGDCCLIAVPRDRYDAFKVLELLATVPAAGIH